MTSAIKVSDLHKCFAMGGLLARRQIYAIRGLSFDVASGEALGIVGESGCGKSTLGRCLVGAEAPTSGSIFVDGAALSTYHRHALAKKTQMVFQDPYSSLNPRMSVGTAIFEVLDVHGIGADVKSRRDRVAELLDLVGLPASARDLLPHVFSGGQRQRISIARAIAANSKIIVADEPVSALDVSVQAQILNLFMTLRARLNLTYIFISHDLHVVRRISDRVAVMYFGQIVEIGPVESLFREPKHPYTSMLLAAVPSPDPTVRSEATTVVGEPPDPSLPPRGCAFRPRCPRASRVCEEEDPVPRPVGDAIVRCHHT